ncbi:MAG: hypothetical protein SWH61_08060 [Thermodesulfobacteriota bacterium]|nr:hypothetical protein [Thermodesulfobacteriota bacterium]
MIRQHRLKIIAIFFAALFITGQAGAIQISQSCKPSTGGCCCCDSIQQQAEKHDCCPADAPCRVERRGLPDVPLLPQQAAATYAHLMISAISTPETAICASMSGYQTLPAFQGRRSLQNTPLYLQLVSFLI